MSRCCGAVVAAVCWSVLLAPRCPAAETVKVYLSAPARAAAGTEVRVEAMIVNTGATEQTVEYAAKVTGLAVDEKALKARVWLGPKAWLPVTWKAKGEAAGVASFGLVIDGKTMGERSVVIATPQEAAVGTAAGELSADKPGTVELPERGGNYELELEVTAGMAGELAATLDGLAGVSGFETNAVVGRDLVGRAVKKGREASDPGLLYALQDASGGWGASPSAAPDARTTSWVLLWLGNLSKAGVEVDAKAVKAAVDYLRRMQAGAGPEMRARVLAALAANGQSGKEDLASLTKAEAEGVSKAGRLLAAYAGADVPLPAGEEWGKLNALELSVLGCCVADKRIDLGGFPLVGQLVRLRGAEPRLDTHEAPLYALALSKLGAQATGKPAEQTVTVRLNGRRVKQFDVGGDTPVVREVLPLAAPSGRPGTVTIEGGRKGGVFFRAVVRPVK